MKNYRKVKRSETEIAESIRRFIYSEITSLHIFEQSGIAPVCVTDSIRAVWTRSISAAKIALERHLFAKCEHDLNYSNGGDNTSTNKQKQTRKTAFIIGDSMVKKIDGYLLTSSVNHKYIVKVRPFLSAKTIDVLDYIKPSKRDFNPDVYLLHVGTNSLSSNKSPEQISMDILNLANSLKLDNNTVIVSSIVPRNDENKKKQMRSI